MAAHTLPPNVLIQVARRQIVHRSLTIFFRWSVFILLEVLRQFLAILAHELACVLHARPAACLTAARGRIDRRARPELVRHVGAEAGKLAVRPIAPNRGLGVAHERLLMVSVLADGDLVEAGVLICQTWSVRRVLLVLLLQSVVVDDGGVWCLERGFIVVWRARVYHHWYLLVGGLLWLLSLLAWVDRPFSTPALAVTLTPGEIRPKLILLGQICLFFCFNFCFIVLQLKLATHSLLLVLIRIPI